MSTTDFHNISFSTFTSTSPTQRAVPSLISPTFLSPTTPSPLASSTQLDHHALNAYYTRSCSCLSPPPRSISPKYLYDATPLPINALDAHHIHSCSCLSLPSLSRPTLFSPSRVAPQATKQPPPPLNHVLPRHLTHRPPSQPRTRVWRCKSRCPFLSKKRLAGSQPGQDIHTHLT